MPLQSHPHSRLFTDCDRQKLTSLNMNEQPREDENTELRCVKDSHASWAEITRPMFRNLLAERPVLGQPDQFTKGFYPQISACPLCGVSAGSFAVSGAHLNAAGSSNVHARRINGKTSRQLRHLFSHPLFDSAITDMLEHISDPTTHLFHLSFPQTSRGYRRAAQTYSSTFHRRQWIKRNGIFIDSNSRAI